MNTMRIKTLNIFLILFCITANMYSQPAYNFDKMQKEKLGRGVVAIRENPQDVVVSWRYLSSDPENTSFNIYRNGKKIANVPSSTGTFYRDNYTSPGEINYTVVPVIKKKELKQGKGNYKLPANAPIGYINIPLDIPADGVTLAGEHYTYSANDASLGDVDGDGEYEIILKWNPSNAHDNAHAGYTGNVFVDCYKLSGEKLWRIDLGKNIRAGAHYTQFLVYDFDGNGRSEVVMKTSDGTIDGKGTVIGDANADYREAGTPDNQRLQGRILTGNEYLTIFNGLTGEAMQTIDYTPGRGNLADWGDTWANRSDRFLAAVGYLDGVRPSAIMCRGYYTRSVLAAYDWDGKNLTQKWVFDSNTPGNEDYAGQGNHNLRVADVDGDGCDEIVYGQCTINNDGTGLYTTKMGHGDAIHLTQFTPSMKGFQVWSCHENKKDGTTLRDAATGEILFQIPSPEDVGRCMAADIDPNHEGLEIWSWNSDGIFNSKGELINANMEGLPVNMGVWWTGDLLREMLDDNYIVKYDWNEGICKPVVVFENCESNNGTKANPCLQADILGDWREEVLMRTADSQALRLYISPIDTDYRFHTFLEDPVYRISIATQNVAYNQPTQPGFYFGEGMTGKFRGYDFDKK